MKLHEVRGAIIIKKKRKKWGKFASGGEEGVGVKEVSIFNLGITKIQFFQNVSELKILVVLKMKNGPILGVKNQ